MPPEGDQRSSPRLTCQQRVVEQQSRGLLHDDQVRSAGDVQARVPCELISAQVKVLLHDMACPRQRRGVAAAAVDALGRAVDQLELDTSVVQLRSQQLEEGVAVLTQPALDDHNPWS